MNGPLTTTPPKWPVNPGTAGRRDAASPSPSMHDGRTASVESGMTEPELPNIGVFLCDALSRITLFENMFNRNMPIAA